VSVTVDPWTPGALAERSESSLLRVQHVIDGEVRDAQSGGSFMSIDPTTRQPWAEVARGDAADAGAAVAAARRAFDDGRWSALGFAERGTILHRLADLLEEHAEALAICDSRDMGKPVAAAIEQDVMRAALNFRFFADHARLSHGDALALDSGYHGYTRYEPAGVVAAVAPWNFPLMLETWKVAPALAWGNTVVLKPAEDTPASATLLALLALRAGVPDGVLNVVHGFGPHSVGSALTESPLVDRITFTGESGTGRHIAAAAARNLTPVSLELGGLGANIIFEDADLDAAIPWSVRAIFGNSGQVCLAGRRLLVARPVYREVVARLVAAADELVLGDPAQPATDIGPLASEEHYRKVCGFLDGLGGAEGRVLTGGATGEGWFVRPTVVVDAAPQARLNREESFGPIVTVEPFDSDDVAIARANATRFGLNAMIFTESLRRAHRVAAALKAGTVWANCFFVRDLRAPFGGVGDSGIGREGGDFSRDFFTEPKAVVLEA
jgi:aminomuconate-semialdehyde/2-hydroxymuconate-6-semialdehyde dehydrogenase